MEKSNHRGVREYHIYLTPEIYKKLSEKATQHGFFGRGNTSHFIEKLASEPLIFLDTNLKTAFGLFGLNLQETKKR